MDEQMKVEQVEEQVKAEDKKLTLSNVITAAVKLPGVKVNREAFLRTVFEKLPKETVELIVEKGPINAGISRELLKQKASRIIKERSALSSGASFLAGIPGGFAIAATIPADIVQFYGIALRMAQELVYLYGEEDIWCENTSDGDRVNNQLILYCGVMLGASGASQSVRVMSSALAKAALKKLPRMALTKTFYYPAIKATLAFFGVHINKTIFAQGVSKALPVVGGVISGGITLSTMMPMGYRLVKVLDKAHFDYTEKDLTADMKVLEELEAKSKKRKKKKVSKSDSLQELERAKALLDNGVITEEEFNSIKEKVISKM